MDDGMKLLGVLVAFGLFFYGIYWVLVTYWHFVLAGGLMAGAGYIAYLAYRDYEAKAVIRRHTKKAGKIIGRTYREGIDKMRGTGQ